MNWPVRITIIIIISAILSTPVIPISSGGPAAERENGTPPSRVPGMEADLIYDEIVKVPPGGETTIQFGPEMDPTEGGYTGLRDWNYGKLGEAAELLPEWLQDPFKENMIKTASREISLGPGMIPTFGDLDGDGDEDLLIGYRGDLYYYNNTGTQGYPVYARSHHVILDYYGWGVSWISPTLCDIDHDGDTDILVGSDRGGIQIGINNWLGEEGFWFRFGHFGTDSGIYTSLSFLNSEQIPTNDSHYAYELTLAIGLGEGELSTFTIDVHEIEYDPYGPSRFRNPRTNEVEISGIPRSLNFTSPLAWQHNMDQTENYPDIVMGSGEGTMIYYRLNSVEGNTVTYRPDPTYFQGIVNPGPINPTFTDLDGDRQPDLVVGSGNDFLSAYGDYQTPSDPYWTPDPHVPAFQVVNYESSFGMNIMEYNESLIEDLLDLIIFPPDTRYRDEIGFCCAYMPPSQLIGDTMDDLLRDNVYYIYSRDGYLEYVTLEEYPGDNYYTTAEYRVRNGDKIEYMEIPRDIYYWGIVHPRVTEERVAYVSPDDGQPTHPDNGGRFWREYVFDHADDQYPEGPEYPEDWTGRVAYYPKDDSPPLLRDVLDDVNVLWDLMPYSYPRGYDNNGENNGHPWDYRDHAVEKVSHWVEKTLVINQQESPDNERPTQPVRIAHHHNGNCGELQDLTIAAARSSLIPARGILLMGEDHVWSEFYLGGWHQWDNYWSDGGGVVADQMNYWWGWRDRGGSGLMAYMGDGQAYDVGNDYRPTDITGELVVNVVDASGDPVDSARVLVLSHWAMEQINVDLGPYQGPPPATIPLPSIWGYTDQFGVCTLDIWRQSFNYRVVSDIGTFVSEKFTMPDTGSIHHTVQLENEMPDPSYQYPGGYPPDSGKKYVVYAEMIGTEQSQTDFTSGVRYNEKTDAGSVAISLFVDDNGARAKSFDVLKRFDEYTPYVRSFSSGGMNATISLRTLNSIKSTNLIRVKIFELEDTGGSEPSMITFNPLGRKDEGFENWGDSLLSGVVLDPTESIIHKIVNLSIEGMIHHPAFLMIESTNNPDWSIPWYAVGTTGQPGSMNPISLNIETNEGNDRSFPTSIYIVDTTYPRWTSIEKESVYSWGGKAKIGLNFSEEVDLLGWIGFDPIGGDEVSGGWDPSAGEWEIDTADLPSGGNRFRMVMIDSQDNLQTLTFGFRLDPVPPNLTVISPRNGSQIDENTIEIAGSVIDDVSLTSFTASVPGKSWNLLDKVGDDGIFKTKLILDPEPGPVVINFTAVDNVGLVSTYDLHIEILEKPDTLAPTVAINSPDEGDEIEKGEILTIRGTAEDDRGIASIQLGIPGSPGIHIQMNLLPYWEMEADTAEWPIGVSRITVTAVDAAGNAASSSVNVEIYEEEVEFRDRREPEIFITSPYPNDRVNVGDRITVTGMLEDDGEEIELFVSMDGGETMVDVTDHIESDWSFSFTMDTADLVKGLSLSTDRLKQYLDEYEVILIARDGAGRVTYLGLPLSVGDSGDPSIVTFEVLDIHENTRKIEVRTVIMDETMLESVRFTLIDDLGRVVEEDEISGMDIEGGDGVYTVNWSFDRSMKGGQYTLEVAAVDPWGNSDIDRLDVSVPAIYSGDESDTAPIMIRILTAVGIIILLLVIIYAAVRISRKISKNKPQ